MSNYQTDPPNPPDPADRGDFGHPLDERIQYPPMYQPKPKKRHRVFMWVFLAVQILFVAWIIAGASTAGGQPTDCGTLDADTCNTASDAGTALGVGLIVAFWFFVDLFLGVGYAVYRLAKRP